RGVTAPAEQRIKITADVLADLTRHPLHLTAEILGRFLSRLKRPACLTVITEDLDSDLTRIGTATATANRHTRPLSGDCQEDATGSAMSSGRFVSIDASSIRAGIDNDRSVTAICARRRESVSLARTRAYRNARSFTAEPEKSDTDRSPSVNCL